MDKKIMIHTIQLKHHQNFWDARMISASLRHLCKDSYLSGEYLHFTLL